MADAIAARGIRVERVPLDFPRDYWIFLGDGYRTAHHTGIFGVGGYYQLGRDYVLVSDRITVDYDVSTPEDITRLVKWKTGLQSYIVPAGYASNNLFSERIRRERWFDHIDLSCLLIPQANLLFVDSSHYAGGHHAFSKVKDQFLKIGDEAQLAVEFYEPSSAKEAVQIPLNCLVVPDAQYGQIIFANENTPGFNDMLRGHNLEVATVRLDNLHTQRASIACCTNLKGATMTVDSLLPDEFALMQVVRQLL